MLRIHTTFILAACLIAMCVDTNDGAAAENDDFRMLLRMASTGFTQGKETISPLDDTPFALAIAANDEHPLSGIAKWIVVRNYFVHRLRDAEAKRDEHFMTGVNVARGIFREEAIRSAAQELLGNERNWEEDIMEMAKGMEPVVGIAKDVVDAQTTTYHIAIYGSLVERMLQNEIRAHFRRDRKSQAENSKPSPGFRVFTDDYVSENRPFASFRITHRGDTPRPLTVVFVKLQCRFKADEKAKASKAFGQALTDQLLGEVAPNYLKRDLVREQYGNTPKGATFVVENWMPQQTIEVLGIAAPVYFSTVDSASIEILGDDIDSSYSIDVAKHKKALEAKFRPKSDLPTTKGKPTMPQQKRKC